MKTIWTSQPSSYKGNFVAFRDAEICPKPRQKPHPPLWIGGWTEAGNEKNRGFWRRLVAGLAFASRYREKIPGTQRDGPRARQRPGRYPPRCRSPWMY